MLGQLVSSGIGTFIVHYKLFGMFGAVGCVRMSERTMNSRLFRCRLSEPGVGLPKLIKICGCYFLKEREEKVNDESPSGMNK